MNKSLRMGKKECPTCRIPCSSRRNLRPDPNFDTLIKVLYPNLEQYEQQEETFIQEINNKYVMRAASVEEGMRRQQQAAKRSRSVENVQKKEKEKERKKEPKTKKPKIEVGTLTPAVSTPNKSKHSAPAPLSAQEDVSIAIAPYPGENTLTFLPRPFLRIPAAACVRHVIKFLALKFPNVDPSTLKVALGTGVQDSVKFAKKEPCAVELEDLGQVIKENKALSEDSSLPLLRAAWKRRDEMLLLYYALPKEVAAAPQLSNTDLKIAIITE